MGHGWPCPGSIPGVGHSFWYVTNQPPKANSAVHPSGVGKWVPASAGKAKAGMVQSVSGWTRGVQVKLWESVPYLSDLKVSSRQGAIQIHVYFYLYFTGSSECRKTNKSKLLSRYTDREIRRKQILSPSTGCSESARNMTISLKRPALHRIY